MAEHAPLIAALAVGAWSLLAFVLGVLVGRSIALADLKDALTNTARRERAPIDKEK